MIWQLYAQLQKKRKPKSSKPKPFRFAIAPNLYKREKNALKLILTLHTHLTINEIL